MTKTKEWTAYGHKTSLVLDGHTHTHAVVAGQVARWVHQTRELIKMQICALFVHGKKMIVTKVKEEENKLTTILLLLG